LRSTTAEDDRHGTVGGSALPPGTFAVSRAGEGLVLAAQGAWVIGAARELGMMERL